MSTPGPRIMGFVGFSGAGKTTLLLRLIPELQRRGLRIAAAKHSGHAHPLHKVGSDSERLQAAGASLVAFATPAGLAVVTSGSGEDQLRTLLPTWNVDLVLLEGWKSGPYPLVEVFREEVGPPLWPQWPQVIAVVTDSQLPDGAPPRLGSDDLAAIADFVLERAASL